MDYRIAQEEQSSKTDNKEAKDVVWWADYNIYSHKGFQAMFQQSVCWLFFQHSNILMKFKHSVSESFFPCRIQHLEILSVSDCINNAW